MKSKNPHNFFYFLNGSIGDILMAKFLLENVYLNNKNINIHAVVPRGSSVFKDLTKDTSYIKIIEANKSSIFGILNTLGFLRYFFSRNFILLAPSQGVLPLRLKVVAKILSFRSQSILVGFEDGSKWNKVLFHKILNFDTSVLYYEVLKNALLVFDFKILKDKPTLTVNNIENQNYVVVHPFGATTGRSIVGDDLRWLLHEIKNNFNGKIFITGSKENEIEINEVIFDDIEKKIALPINDLCNFINSSKFYIGVDTGPTHIASLLGKKSLVIAKNGTPNWLPFYNNNATILYKVDQCTHGVFTGRDHLEECRGKRLRCLGDVPTNIIKNNLEIFLKNE